MIQENKRKKLEEFVALHPTDAFARYGLALECANTGDNEAAVSHFHALLDANPEYVPGYFHFGQLLARLQRVEDARGVLRSGVAAAKKAGNQHALEEMQAALAELG